MKNKKNKTSRKLSISFISLIILIACACITTLALTFEKVSVENNKFQTGNIKINLNDGKPVIEDDFNLEPGMTIIKDFFIENVGSNDVYYKLYFKNIKGELAEQLEIKIKDKEKVIYSGKISNLTKLKPLDIDDVLQVNERKDYILEIHMPKETTNNYQDTKLTFILSADAVQTKNNENREFD